jgi:hypothetical protein
MLLRRILLHVRTENWFAVFLDLLVVVVGLFIGLQIDTWWEAQRESRFEGAYLTELREDFELNQSRLDNSLAELEEIAHNMVALHESAALKTPNLSVAELNQKFRSMGNMPTFIPVNRAYTNLTGSGDLRLIQNRQLKNALADYYAAAQLTLLVQNTHEMELVQIYEPYIIANLDYAAVQTTRVDDFSLPPPREEASILSVVGTREFRNVLTQKWVITTDLLSQHRGMLERTKKILQLLEPTDQL